MSKTKWSLFSLGARIVGSVLGADGLADILDAHAGIGDIHDSLATAGGDAHDILHVADLHVSDFDAIGHVTAVSDISLGTDTLNAGGVHDIYDSAPPADLWGRTLQGNAHPAISPLTDFHSAPLTDANLNDLGYHDATVGADTHADELEWHREPGSNRWHYFDAVEPDASDASDVGSANAEPLRPGESADFGGVYGGLPTDQYGNGPKDIHGGNPYVNGQGNLPKDIWGNPWTGPH